MDRGPDAVREAVELVRAANLRVRRQLETNEKLLEAVLEMTGAGTPLFAALDSLAWVPERQSSDDAIRELYEARRILVDVAVATVVGEGRAPAEIAESFGMTPGQVAGIVARSAVAADAPPRSDPLRP